MSYVIAAPDMMTAAATDLSTIDADLSHAHSAATRATVALTPAAADEVSAGVAHLFSRYAQDFHGLAGKAARFHQQFAQNLRTGAASYASADDPIDSLLPPGMRWGWDKFKSEIHSGLVDTGRRLGVSRISIPSKKDIEQNPEVQSLGVLVAFLGVFIGGPVALVLLAPIWIPLLVVIQLIKRLGLGSLLP